MAIKPHNLAQTNDAQSRIPDVQFVSTCEANVAALTGSPVKVIIDSVKAGSTVVTETYAFLDNSATGAANLVTVLKSGNSVTIFGTDFGAVSVNASSVTTGTVTNPSSKRLCLGAPCCSTSLLLSRLF